MWNTKQQIDAIGTMLAAFWNVNKESRHGSARMIDQNDWDRYLDEIKQEELGHRRFTRGFAGRYRITVPKAVDLFAVQRILEYRAGDKKKPAVELVGHWQLSTFLAWNLWANYKKEIRKAVPMKAAREWLANVDYATLTGSLDH